MYLGEVLMNLSEVIAAAGAIFSVVAVVAMTLGVVYHPLLLPGFLIGIATIIVCGTAVATSTVCGTALIGVGYWVRRR